MVRIGSNSSSLSALRQLGQSTAALENSFERLSSGERINRASDDAAGLAIAMQLQANVRVKNQGIRNANDGISMLNVASGAIDSLKAIAIRLEELATSAANGTVSSVQRRSVDKEVQELVKEHNRIIDSTSYNGIKLFGEQGADITIQAGESAISTSLTATAFVGTGTFTAVTTFSSVGILTSLMSDLDGDGNLDVLALQSSTSTLMVLRGNGNGTFTGATTYYLDDVNESAYMVKDVDQDGNLDVLFANSAGMTIMRGNADGTFGTVSKVTGTVVPQGFSVLDANSDGVLDLMSGTAGSARTNLFLGNGDGTFKAVVSSVVINRLGGREIVGDFNNDGRDDVLATGVGVNLFLSNGDGTFRDVRANTLSNNGFFLDAGDFNGDGNLDYITNVQSSSAVGVFLGNGDGTFRVGVSVEASLSLSQVLLQDMNDDGTLDTVTGIAGAIGVALGNGDGTFQALVSRAASGFARMDVGDINNDGVDDILGSQFSLRYALGIGTYAPRTLSQTKLADIDVLSRNNARQVLSTMDRHLDFLSNVATSIGVSQKRLEIAASNLQTGALAETASEKRIRDVDIAEESSRLVANKILQQSASAVLAQATQQPQLALALLKF